MPMRPMRFFDRSAFVNRCADVIANLQWWSRRASSMPLLLPPTHPLSIPPLLSTEAYLRTCCKYVLTFLRFETFYFYYVNHYEYYSFFFFVFFLRRNTIGINVISFIVLNIKRWKQKRGKLDRQTRFYITISFCFLLSFDVKPNSKI